MAGKQKGRRMPPFWNCGPQFAPCGPMSFSTFRAAAPPPPPGSTAAAAAAAPPPPPQRSVRSFVDGIISPFVNCVQPPLQSCVAPNTKWEPSIRGRSPQTQIVSPHGEPHELKLSPQHLQPTENISQPHENDVLCGRGGSSNRHKGNLNFRELIAANKGQYTGLTKKQKMMIARQIVDMVHNTNPPGRFLARDGQSYKWHDIGLPRSLEKTSQALREKSASEKAAAAAANEDIDVEADGHNSPCSLESEQTTSKRSCRKVEAPVIIIPDHLKSVYRLPKDGVRHHPPPPPFLQTPPLGPPAVYDVTRRPNAPILPPSFRPSNMTGPPQITCPLRTPSIPGPPPPPPPPPRPVMQTSAPPVMELMPPVETPSGIPTMRSTSSTRAPSIISSNSSGSARHSTDVSPGRAQEWKRQRTSTASSPNRLSGAIESKLSLQDRVVGHDITSPSSLLQGRSGQRQIHGRIVRERIDSEMDGLAALSTAAFLRLDEAE